MIGICTVVYNKLDFVTRCVEAVSEKTEPPYYHVLIYNDSPYPGVKEYLKELEEAGLKVIWNVANVGVAKAYFQGYAEMPDEVTHFVKLDDDTVVLTQGWNKKMEFAYKVWPNLAALSLDIDSGKQGGECEELSHKGVTLEVFVHPCVGVAATMYPVKAFAKLGFFKDFGYYGFEDLAFCTEAREAGYLTAYLQDVKCQHLGRTHESDSLYDEWKLAYHYKQTDLEFRDWRTKKEERNAV